MNIIKQTILGGALILGSSSAMAISVGGVTWDENAGLDFFSTGTIFESFAGAVGQDIVGYGQVETINGVNDQSTFCPTCELTFGFSYKLTQAVNESAVFDGTDTVITTTTQTWNGASIDTTVVNSVAANIDISNSFDNDSSDFIFSDGLVTMYVDNPGDYDGTAPSQVAATNGDIWLAMAANGVLSGSADNLFNLSLISGDGAGFLDVTGGLAAANFDTNTLAMTDGSFADIQFTSSFQLPNGGTEAGFPLGGTLEIKGDSISVPEPTSLALIGLGLLGLSSARKRK